MDDLPQCIAIFIAVLVIKTIIAHARGALSLFLKEKLQKHEDRYKLALWLASGMCSVIMHGVALHSLYPLLLKGGANYLYLLAYLLIYAFLAGTFWLYLPNRFYRYVAALETEEQEKYQRRFEKQFGWISALYVFFFPLIWLVSVFSAPFIRVRGFNPKEEPVAVTEDTILDMVEAGSESGAIDENENEIIRNVLSFDDTSVGDIATHRTDMEFLWAEDELSEWNKQIRESSRSYFPICGESIDQVVGVLSAKIYLRMENPTKEQVMAEAVKEPLFVPESVDAATILAQMKSKHQYFAVVLDEYGGTHGIVTLTDLVSELVGDVVEEDEIETIPDIREVGDHYLVQASCPLGDFADFFLEGEEPEAEASTVGGYCMERLGGIPEIGEHFVENGFRFTVVKKDNRHVLELKISKIEEV